MSERSLPIRIVIADDHLMVRMGLRMMLRMGEGMELVGEANDGKEAIQLAETLRPDVVLMDLRMPVMDGLEALTYIRQHWPEIAVLILTTYNEDDLMIKGLQAGAHGYLLKDTTLETLHDAIVAAARGEILLQAAIMKRVLEHTTPTYPAPLAPAGRKRSKTNLTERELEVLAAVAQGQRNKEIARSLKVSERTIWAYLTNIYTKLDVDSRTSAVTVAIKRGLLPLQEGEQAFPDRDNG
ncbi:response regulator transcription factor [Ktedonosporobacter rubrisoli]|uniref:Response regulator transcription factor n=1 Tax=Ktedonosporobacter rubrisoli TaxID=2509675 RepID=A0A4P6K395_KTERU|nr:response regulator transcription factor [Ktedonosporobacter rubrisoli]QBD82422.1 response regulator transcription factor [Ktedonosporobacter rubrisoli]